MAKSGIATVWLARMKHWPRRRHQRRMGKIYRFGLKAPTEPTRKIRIFGQKFCSTIIITTITEAAPARALTAAAAVLVMVAIAAKINDAQIIYSHRQAIRL